jgi:predicted aspartyl protease
MSLIFPYDNFPTLYPVWALNGRMDRPRPTIIVALLGPSGVVVRKALVDTGADDSVFPAIVAARIGMDLSNAPIGTATGIAQPATTLLR